MQTSLKKNVPEISGKNLPSKTVPALLESVLYGQHLMLLYDLVFCAKKQNAASKNVPVIHLEKSAERYSPYSSYGPRFLCYTAYVRPRNSCRVRTVINAVPFSFSVPCLTSISVPFKPYCTAAWKIVPFSLSSLSAHSPSPEK